jgi:hypothetical protein
MKIPRITRRGALIGAGAAALAAMLVGALVAATGSTTQAAVARPAAAGSIIGAWSVTVQGAPFSPHLYTFLPGGVVLGTNPTDVQAAGADGTNDSVAMGMWRKERRDVYVGTFVELNAWSDSAAGPGITPHTPAPALIVTFRVRVVGDALSGDAQAGLWPDMSKPVDLTQLRPARFVDGHRITINYPMLAFVP